MRIVCFTLFLTATTAYACINIEGVTIDGKYTQVLSIGQEDEHPILQETLRAQPSSRLATLTNVQEDEQTDAVRDIYSGNYGTAIEKLEALETTRPGNYSTAANLGTAYELAGDNEKALYWITEGIKRNERAHYGSEWLHKKILEVKIAMESDPDYLKTNHILPITESSTWTPDIAYDYDGESYENFELARAFHYQLGERMLFVKPTDPVVADLLYSLAILEANTRVLEPAVELLQLAKEYGYHDTAELDQRMTRYQQIIDSTWKISTGDIVKWVVGFSFYSLMLLLIGLIVRTIVRRNRRARDSAAR